MNYFLWSLIPMAITQYSMREFDWAGLKKNNYLVRRKDGGEYAASACVYEEKVNEIIENEYLCGPMYRGETKERIFAWELSSKFDGRIRGWEDSETRDYVSLNMYLKGKLPKTEALLDKYVRLYERGLLRQEDDSVNVIVVKEAGEEGLLSQIVKYEAHATSVSEEMEALEKVDFAGYLRNYILFRLTNQQSSNIHLYR